MKKSIQLAVLLSVLASDSYAQSNSHPTADEFSRFIVAGLKHGITQANPAKGACLADMSDTALSDTIHGLISSNLSTTEIKKFDSLYGSSLGKRWTDDKILYGLSSGKKHGTFTAIELDKIARIADTESGKKLEEITLASNPAIRAAILEIVKGRASQCQ